MEKEKIQEYDGYKISRPRHFTEEELKELDKERQEKIKEILSQNPHLSNTEK